MANATTERMNQNRETPDQRESNHNKAGATNASPNSNTVAGRTMDMFDQASESIKASMDAGMKMQRDMARTLFGAFFGMDRMDDVRRRAEGVATESQNMFRRNAEQGQKLFAESCRIGAEMMDRSLEAMRPVSEIAPGKQANDVFECCRSAWKNGFDAASAGFDAISRANVQAVENMTGAFNQAKADAAAR